MESSGGVNFAINQNTTLRSFSHYLESSGGVNIAINQNITLKIFSHYLGSSGGVNFAKANDKQPPRHLQSPSGGVQILQQLLIILQGPGTLAQSTEKNVVSGDTKTSGSRLPGMPPQHTAIGTLLSMRGKNHQRRPSPAEREQW